MKRIRFNKNCILVLPFIAFFYIYNINNLDKGGLKEGNCF